MTKEQAIQVLNTYYRGEDNDDREFCNAIDMAIKALEQQPSEDCERVLNRVMEYTYGMLTAEKIGLQHLIKSMIDELPPVTPTQKWIPVSERLPEKVGTYLVTLEYKEHGKGITTLWYHGKQLGWDFCVADVVIAWQPLPKPYEEKRGNEE